jgi:hypothetical protein
MKQNRNNLSLVGAAAGYASFHPKYIQVKAQPGLKRTLLLTARVTKIWENYLTGRG